eukprot:3393513-Rhodomonas_salina.1
MINPNTAVKLKGFCGRVCISVLARLLPACWLTGAEWASPVLLSTESYFPNKKRSRPSYAPTNVYEARRGSNSSSTRAIVKYKLDPSATCDVVVDINLESNTPST